MKMPSLSLVCRLCWAGFAIVLLIGIVHITWECAVTGQSAATSFPWYSPIVLTGIFYLPPLAILGAGGTGCLLAERRRAKRGQNQDSAS